jgi:tripartite-type tricarboxylate transporter receptor subunit TctC
MTRSLIRTAALCILLSVVLAHNGAHAQVGDNASRPVRVLYGFSPGSDIAARFITETIAERTGQPTVFENVAGAAGNIAADQLARAEPNGHTLGILTGANIVLRPLLHQSVPYEPLKALIPISLLWRFPALLVVGPETKAKDFSELIERARRAPGELTFAHLGAGSVTHLTGELLKITADIDIRGVPYRSVSALISDIISGRVDMAFIPPSTAIPLANQGQVRALATTSGSRSPSTPNLPTIAEMGYPGFEVAIWFGAFAPANTPQPVVNRIGTLLRDILATPKVRERLLQLGIEPIGGTQAEFMQTILDEKKLWSNLVEKAGIKPIE